MMLNASKSEALVVGTRSQLSKFMQPVYVTVDDAHLQCGKSLTTLGINIDPELALTNRVSSIVSACNFHLRAFRRIRPLLPNDLAETVGRAIVMSRLDYCNALFSALPEYQIMRLQRLENQCVRIVASQSARSEVTTALSDLHWLPVRERIDFKVATLTYSALSGSGPQYLSNLLITAIPARSLRSSADISRLVIPRTKTKFQERPFSVAAPIMWNSLPSEIRTSATIDTFKSKLKTYLFNRANLV